MSIRKSLDKGIMLQETGANPKLTACYWVEGRPYENYLSNESWEAFKTDMEQNHPVAYEQYALGGGKEMEERKAGKYTYPPKMASFGSSSRMIYNLMKDNADFLYEKKLPTTVGGTANLDGFVKTSDSCVFVEAKCREPYGDKNGEIAEKYQALYTFLTVSENNNLRCSISNAENGKIQVRFYAGQLELRHFDIKQMISHLLGVATAYLLGQYDKKIDFIYLLYNPTGLQIENKTHQQQIRSIYHRECTECGKVDFAGLFYDILWFLAKKEKVGSVADVPKIAAAFSFRMCDQFTMDV